MAIQDMELEEVAAPLVDSKGNELRPLNEDEIKAAVAGEIMDALDFYQGEIHAEREKALDYYYGQPFGNEQEGRSAVVMTDVADTIEWIMPQLMRMFTGGPELVRYEPLTMEEESNARQATRCVNNYFRNKMNGFQLLFDFFKSALMQKRGYTHTSVKKYQTAQIYTYEGLTEDELARLAMDPGIAILSHEVEETPLGPRYNIECRRDGEVAEIDVVGIEPSKVVVNRRASALDDETLFSCVRERMTKSQLIAEGFDAIQVMELPSDEMHTWEDNSSNYDIENLDENITTSSRPDVASHEVWVNECYIRLDEDGDGYSELRHIVAVGENSVEILLDEPCNWNPIASICPVPTPHKFMGQSIADLVMDLQLIRSTLVRQMLDNLYLSNNQRLGIVDGEVEIDDLLISRPGGLVRMNQPGMIEPIPVVPFGPMAFNMLEFFEQVRQNRTGITKYTQGMDAQSLNQTAHGISRIMDASQMRIEMIARIFAETGVKQMFRNILRGMVESGVQEWSFRIDGQWATFNPSSWNMDMDVNVVVGLGVGEAAERLQNLQLILTLQEQLAARGFMGYMVQPKQIYEGLRQVQQTMGYHAEGMFFTDPGDQPPPEVPDPEQIKAQIEAAAKDKENELKARELEIQAQEDQDLKAHRLMELESKKEIAFAEIASKERIAEAQVDLKARELDIRDKEADAKLLAAKNRPKEKKNE